MTICYLALGSNLNSPQRQLRSAINSIRTLPYSHILDIASFYPNKAWGRKCQPNFVNTVISLFTALPPETLLKKCQQIEQKHQRIRHIRYAARTLDIDILLYGKKFITTSQLTIPHPRMLEREFVIGPLKEIHPSLNLLWINEIKCS